VGDEDSGLQEPLDVPLTTVQAHKFEMGEAAVALLLERIQKGPDGGQVARQQVPMRLKVRRSCGARRT
jgi:DNA-binding LacI/PurR family transcriptional regulator